ncbi:MAG: hypothetical protein R3B40_26945 [Polyangiales bacterium]
MHFEAITQLPTAWTMASGRFGVHLFEGALTVDDMVGMQQRGDVWYAANLGRLVELVVIYPSDSRMSGEERRKMVELMKNGDSRRDASSTVILAEGLVASLQRSILTGLLMLAPPPHPAKICAGVAPAVDFLAPFAQALRTTVTLAGVNQLQRAFEARPGRLVASA